MKAKRKWSRGLGMILGCIMMLVLFPMTASAEGEEGVAINEENFPDENFRKIVESYDTNGDKTLSADEISWVTGIYCYEKGISSLKGIEHFTALKALFCSDNKLTSLDVSKNKTLKYLSCDINQLTSLDVSKNTALETLFCADNELTNLDVSKNTVLEALYCSDNELTSLDVSKNTTLLRLYCYDNQLTSLDVSKNMVLKELYCSDNEITSLDVSRNTALRELSCYNNQLSALDVSKNIALKILGCFNNQREVEVGYDRVFDLSTLPNFDLSKATNWNGCTVNGNYLRFNNDVVTATYDYDCGNSNFSMLNFTLCAKLPPCVFDQEIVKNEALKSPADFIHDAVYYKSCLCGEISTTETFTAINTRLETVELAKTVYVYDGKTKNPKLTVKNGAGETISSKYYTLKKPAGRKAVGTYIYKITFKGNYKGTKTLTFTINPKGTTLVSVKAESKGFTVKWKKQTAQTTGYEIRYATNQKMDKAKTVKITKNGETSRKITKLAAKKKYYVQIRTYKKVGSKTYYSDWSKTKTVTTKK